MISNEKSSNLLWAMTPLTASIRSNPTHLLQPPRRGIPKHTPVPTAHTTQPHAIKFILGNKMKIKITIIRQDV